MPLAQPSALRPSLLPFQPPVAVERLKPVVPVLEPPRAPLPPGEARKEGLWSWDVVEGAKARSEAIPAARLRRLVNQVAKIVQHRALKAGAHNVAVLRRRTAAALALQRAVRGFQARCRVRRMRQSAAALRVQTAARRWLVRALLPRLREQRRQCCALRIQSAARGLQGRRRAAAARRERDRRCAVRLQCLVRRVLAERELRRLRAEFQRRVVATIHIQCAARSRAARRLRARLLRQRAAATRIQTAARGAQGRRLAARRRRAIQTAQCAWRCALARRRAGLLRMRRVRGERRMRGAFEVLAWARRVAATRALRRWARAARDATCAGIAAELREAWLAEAVAALVAREARAQFYAAKDAEADRRRAVAAMELEDAHARAHSAWLAEQARLSAEAREAERLRLAAEWERLADRRREAAERRLMAAADGEAARVRAAGAVARAFVAAVGDAARQRWWSRLERQRHREAQEARLRRARQIADERRVCARKIQAALRGNAVRRRLAVAQDIARARSEPVRRVWKRHRAQSASLGSRRARRQARAALLLSRVGRGHLARSFVRAVRTRAAREALPLPEALEEEHALRHLSQKRRYRAKSAAASRISSRLRGHTVRAQLLRDELGLIEADKPLVALRKEEERERRRLEALRRKQLQEEEWAREREERLAARAAARAAAEALRNRAATMLGRLWRGRLARARVAGLRAARAERWLAALGPLEVPELRLRAYRSSTSAPSADGVALSRPRRASLVLGLDGWRKVREQMHRQRLPPGLLDGVQQFVGSGTLAPASPRAAGSGGKGKLPSVRLDDLGRGQHRHRHRHRRSSVPIF